MNILPTEHNLPKAQFGALSGARPQILESFKVVRAFWDGLRGVLREGFVKILILKGELRVYVLGEPTYWLISMPKRRVFLPLF
jgi:hypothetical protein